MARKRLGEILIQAGLLDEGRLRTALREQQRWGGPLGRTLIEMKLVREDDLVRALSVQLNFPVATDLAERNIAPAVLDHLPTEFCEENAVIPFHQDGRFLEVALCDPTNLSILEEIRIRTRLNVRPYIIGPQQLEKAIGKHYKGIDLSVPVRAPQGSYGAHLGGVRYVDFSDGASKPPATSSRGGAGTGRPPASVAPGPGAHRPPTLGGAAAAAPMAVRVAVSPSPTPERGGPILGSSADPIDRAAFEQLQRRVTELEALLARDESVIRKLLGLLVESNLVSREQILACLQD
jgi:type IV pilus assembly protein PilB